MPTARAWSVPYGADAVPRSRPRALTHGRRLGATGGHAYRGPRIVRHTGALGLGMRLGLRPGAARGWRDGSLTASLSLSASPSIAMAGSCRDHCLRTRVCTRSRGQVAGASCLGDLQPPAVGSMLKKPPGHGPIRTYRYMLTLPVRLVRHYSWTYVSTWPTYSLGGACLIKPTRPDWPDWPDRKKKRRGG